MTDSNQSRSHAGRGRFWLVYALWILLCGALFATLEGAPDPALPQGRLTENEAVAVAGAIVRNRPQLAAHQLVHAAWSSAGELGDEARWVMLFKPPEAPRLEGALVIELSGVEGRLIRLRKYQN